MTECYYNTKRIMSCQMISLEGQLAYEIKPPIDFTKILHEEHLHKTIGFIVEIDDRPPSQFIDIFIYIYTCYPVKDNKQLVLLQKVNRQRIGEINIYYQI